MVIIDLSLTHMHTAPQRSLHLGLEQFMARFVHAMCINLIYHLDHLVTRLCVKIVVLPREYHLDIIEA